jgi:hypothetical protein
LFNILGSSLSNLKKKRKRGVKLSCGSKVFMEFNVDQATHEFYEKYLSNHFFKIKKQRVGT